VQDQPQQVAHAVVTELNTSCGDGQAPAQHLLLLLLLLLL
jgi:hypothetical protein